MKHARNDNAQCFWNAISSSTLKNSEMIFHSKWYYWIRMITVNTIAHNVTFNDYYELIAWDVTRHNTKLCTNYLIFTRQKARITKQTILKNAFIETIMRDVKKMLNFNIEKLILSLWNGLLKWKTKQPLKSY